MCLAIEVYRPELILARGEHLGYQWRVTNNGIGFRCGYVRVPKGHPWHGVPRQELDLDVHGGITFAEPDVSCDKGEPDDAYWVGFDMGHAFDDRDYSLAWDSEEARITMQAIDRECCLAVYGMPERPQEPFPHTIKTTEYVEAECLKLCEQAARAV